MITLVKLLSSQKIYTVSLINTQTQIKLFNFHRDNNKLKNHHLKVQSSRNILKFSRNFLVFDKQTSQVDSFLPFAVSLMIYPSRKTGTFCPQKKFLRQLCLCSRVFLFFCLHYYSTPHAVIFPWTKNKKNFENRNGMLNRTVGLQRWRKKVTAYSAFDTDFFLQLFSSNQISQKTEIKVYVNLKSASCAVDRLRTQLGRGEVKITHRRQARGKESEEEAKGIGGGKKMSCEPRENLKSPKWHYKSFKTHKTQKRFFFLIVVCKRFSPFPPFHLLLGAKKNRSRWENKFMDARNSIRI